MELQQCHHPINGELVAGNATNALLLRSVCKLMFRPRRKLQERHKNRVHVSLHHLFQFIVVGHESLMTPWQFTQMEKGGAKARI